MGVGVEMREESELVWGKYEWGDWSNDGKCGQGTMASVASNE